MYLVSLGPASPYPRFCWKTTWDPRLKERRASHEASKPRKNLGFVFLGQLILYSFAEVQNDKRENRCSEKKFRRKGFNLDTRLKVKIYGLSSLSAASAAVARLYDFAIAPIRIPLGCKFHHGTRQISSSFGTGEIQKWRINCFLIKPLSRAP